jgi:hypothetical protein
MKSQALQELVKTIFDDKETRLEFESNPDKVLSRFKLTEEEKKAVLNTHTKLGLVTSNSQQLEESIGPTWTWSAPTP